MGGRYLAQIPTTCLYHLAARLHAGLAGQPHQPREIAMTKKITKNELTDEQIDRLSNVLAVWAEEALRVFISTHREFGAILSLMGSSPAYREMMIDGAFSTFMMLLLSLSADNSPELTVNHALDGVEAESGRLVELRHYIFEMCAIPLRNQLGSDMSDDEHEDRVRDMIEHYNHIYNADHVETEEA
jgi:hypothetical protein